jgi:hypothetical protein
MLILTANTQYRYDAARLLYHIEHTFFPAFPPKGETMDLVLIDQQSVGKRSQHLMDTVYAKKRYMTIYWRVNNF